ncbi:unnamed protein product, partial [marine sediment metagenome]
FISCILFPNNGGRGTRTPKGLLPAVFKTAALPLGLALQKLGIRAQDTGNEQMIVEEKNL